MKLSFLFCLLSVTFKCSCQVKLLDEIRSCSEIMNEISYYWKKDSVANNGFRFYTYKMLLECKFDNLDTATLLSKLGQPNSLLKTNKGYEYRYFYFDILQMPKGYDAPAACWYISFNFGLKGKYLLEIKTGDMERYID